MAGTVSARLRLLALCSIAVFASLLFALPSAQAYLTDTIEDETIVEGYEPIPPRLSPEQENELSQIKEPKLSPEQIKAILEQYLYVDPHRTIPRVLLDKALVFYHVNKPYLPNPNYLSIINFSLHSSEPRFYIIAMATGEVSALHAAHGTGSDPNSTGYATRFSNKPGSHQSSLGFYRTAETYFGKHGYSLRLDGLSDTNSNARARAIVIHGASYVQDKNVKQGRSWGCPAVSMAQRTKVIDMLKEGSLIYAGLEK